jgi:uncharacterized OB-fold protein
VVKTTTHVRPELDELTIPFWTSGRDGVLRIQRCERCRRWVHPPRPRCPSCLAADLDFEGTSGQATVWSYTINRQAWSDDVIVPYGIAIVELPEQPGLRLTTRIVDVPVEDIRIGLPVRVVFESVDELFLPLFTAA